MRKVKQKKNIFIYSVAVVFIIIVLSLGSVYATSAGSMSIFGQVYFVTQLSGDKLPIYPIPNGNNPNEYFTPNISGQERIEIIEQKYEDGDLYLSICSSNSNNGNTSFSISFSFLNPTSYTWTNGTATVLTYPTASGGIANNSFTFRSATATPTTVVTNQEVLVTLDMQAQLGKIETCGSAIVNVTYNVSGGARSTKIYFKYYARTASECSLT